MNPPRVIIFVGPSLSESEVKQILPEALVLPSAEQGDIDFARYQLGADVIGLIDGVHTQKLPCIHKEILSVIDDGCRFVGAASMGALRAVECEDYGAEPIGEVAKWYKEGVIDGDDEVCLVHADKESGYKHLSVPMVNIRATMRAVVIDQSIKNDIIDFAKSLFYPDREWQNIFDGCSGCIDNATESIIRGSTCDIKGADALHLCYYINSGKERPPIKKKAQNAHYGFASVFENNDRKIMHHNKVIRKYQIAEKASGYDRMNTRNRRLAIELCWMLGINNTIESDPFPFTAAHDMTPQESKELVREEMMLNRAGEWISSRANSSDVVKAINDFLIISGRYDNVKENI